MKKYQKGGCPMKETLRPVLRIQLYTEEKCFGPGIGELLRQVERHHSLRAAAQAMDMAYSKAWTRVRDCEQALGFALLHSTTGGAHGGGAALSPEAKELLSRYNAYCEALQKEAQRLFLEHFPQNEEHTF